MMSASKSTLTRNPSKAILQAVLEADEDFDIKDLNPTDPTGGKAKVERRGRWKLVRMPDYTFLISYLTPVAYYDKNLNEFFRTSKWWSMTTEQHIRDWESEIYNSPEWRSPERAKKSDYGDWITYDYPHFKRKPQKQISALFFKLMSTMELSAAEKKRMYYVDPQMRKGSEAAWRSRSGHLKHHDTGEEGLPMTVGQAQDANIPPEFFKDFQPDEPEFFDWDEGHGRRTYEPYEPDERGRRPKRED